MFFYFMENNDISKIWLKTFFELTEPHKRWIAAVKANELGYGGISIVSRLTGLSRNTIMQGMRDLQKRKLVHTEDGIRKEGGGRKTAETSDPKIIKAVEDILKESSAGDPMSHLRWTCKSTRSIADLLDSSGMKVSHVTIMRILKDLGYSLRSNKKMLAGKNHPNRDAQFKYINMIVDQFTKLNNPVISVDTKKKELVGNFKNAGTVWT
jgi:hypothetical protein